MERGFDRVVRLDGGSGGGPLVKRACIIVYPMDCTASKWVA